MKHKETLFEEFPPVTAEDWLARINADLKGEDFYSRLVWKTEEGLDVMPFYMQKDLSSLRYKGVVKKNGRWLIRQDIEVNDYQESNSKALDIINKGVDSTGFIISDPDTVTKENVRHLLENISFDTVETNFLSNGKAREILAYLDEIISERGISRQMVRGAIEADPSGRLMINGTLCITPEAGFDYLASLVKESEILPQYRVVHVNGANFGNAGADCVQELAFTMSSFSEYMSQLTDRGITSSMAASKTRLGFATGSDYFMEIAKLRAARILWPAIIKGFIMDGDEMINPEIHCQTTMWNKTLFDPYVNMIRTQAEAMAAVLGGADSITLLPFNRASVCSDEFGERIARNQQLLLREEAFFDKTADPSAGSYYIETLTNLIADAAWKLFLETQEKGGFLSSLKGGFIQQKIRESASRRKEDFMKGRKILVGTNRYRNTDENVKISSDCDKLYDLNIRKEDTLVDPLRLFRVAGEFERADKGKASGAGSQNGNTTVQP
jgi:methylmalonyl-CoA mutase